MKKGVQTGYLVSALLLGLALLHPAPGPAQTTSQTTAQPSSQTAPGLLTREQAGAIMPATVFFRGQTASIQARNSAGIRLPGGKLVLVALVDTSGYSSAVKESYQAYLLTEVPLRVADRTLTPGAYGIGFLASDRFVALDLGGNAIFTVPSLRDPALARPNPLQLVPDPSGSFRLYSGKSYVLLAP